MALGDAGQGVGAQATVEGVKSLLSE